MTMLRSLPLAPFALILLAACSSSSSPATATDGGADLGTTTDAGTDVGAASDTGGEASTGPMPLTSGPQTPPQDGADVETWLATGDYKSWHCEPMVHAARSPSPHGMNRICSNDLASGFSGTGERPEGTAAVKELYDSTGTTIVGHSVYLKAAATSAGGANWYWYEKMPLTAGGAATVIADGYGDSGTAKSVCVACHAAAGSDAAHTPSPGSSDEVYTQVK